MLLVMVWVTVQDIYCPRLKCTCIINILSLCTRGADSILCMRGITSTARSDLNWGSQRSFGYQWWFINLVAGLPSNQLGHIFSSLFRSDEFDPCDCDSCFFFFFLGAAAGRKPNQWSMGLTLWKRRLSCQWAGVGPGSTLSFWSRSLLRVGLQIDSMRNSLGPQNVAVQCTAQRLRLPFIIDRNSIYFEI